MRLPTGFLEVTKFQRSLVPGSNDNRIGTGVQVFAGSGKGVDHRKKEPLFRTRDAADTSGPTLDVAFNSVVDGFEWIDQF